MKYRSFASVSSQKEVASKSRRHEQRWSCKWSRQSYTVRQEIWAVTCISAAKFLKCKNAPARQESHGGMVVVCTKCSCTTKANYCEKSKSAKFFVSNKEKTCYTVGSWACFFTNCRWCEWQNHEHQAANVVTKDLPQQQLSCCFCCTREVKYTGFHYQAQEYMLNNVICVLPASALCALVFLAFLP